MKQRPIWISETEAAEMMGYKPETFRKYVKSGKLDIAFFTLNGRKIKYNKVDIDKVMIKNSTLIS